MSQKQPTPPVPEVKIKPLDERFEVCPKFFQKLTPIPFVTVPTCLLIEKGEPCNRVNYDEQAYPWGLCISLPLQKGKEA